MSVGSTKPAVDVASLAGTATDTNSGNKSAGTLRVVLATDQPALTNKLLVTPDLPSGAATAAKQPALGTAGSASSDVLTIQGVASMTKLLVTPDSVALPANQSVNVAQIAGTTADGNSGNKSAGTLRVVLATDQPALTNKLLVTPDLPSGASTAAKQPALGTAGSASADVLTIQGIASMTKLLVTPDSVALPANQSVNTAQINGVTPLMGAGNTGTGSLRVTIATDQTQLTNALKVDPSGVTSPVSLASVPSHAVTNAGTFATQESGTQVQVDDAAFTPATSKIVMAGYEADESSTDSVDEGDGGAARMTLDRKQIIAPYAHGAGGYLPATGSIGATKTDIGVANTAGTVGGWYFYNPNASVAYVQFFNAQASAVTLGSTAPYYSLGIPATSGANLMNMPGISHTTAISIAITTTRAGSSGPGSTVDYNVWYKQ